ncbi:unnamed protein product [Clonostachys byssicola]|uniref:Carboxylesterase type B domain-containing protein n=1 Tax=Clonostachys byssicola TaxID=160290 RepID=A0A9N9Y5U8_9HYPO|nr:unnamed protein product [Clonostachys byssicola]
MFLNTVLFTSLAIVGSVARVCPDGRGDHDGLVDLGYARHVPTYTNTTTSGHNVTIYKNIRFANAPTGDLRFRRADTDLPHVDGVQRGDEPPGSRDCISSAPAYIPFPGINGTTWGHEDCLFLDVYVPQGVKPGDNVPVLHFFYGSAYSFGSKEFLFSPMGLFENMFEQHKGRFIFVANNYRMGLSGFSYTEGDDMEANVGLFDCLVAARWTSKFIHKFGGDGRRITAAGQSAGAGMLYYMTTLDGGKGELPFQKLFISSPAAPPRRRVADRQREQFDLLLNVTDCATLKCVRSLPEQAILDASDKLVNQMPSTGGGGVLGPVIGYGPAPDGKSLPDLPLAQFYAGEFHEELEGIIMGSMAYEGMGTSHDTDQPEYFPIMVRQIMPNASDEVVSTIQALYYHPETPAQLAWDWTTDAIFSCNSYNLANALPGKSRRYVMSTPPATHGQDLWYFFYVDEEQTPLGEEGVGLAREFQTKLLDFVHGDDVAWPLYGSEKNILNITDRFEETTWGPDLTKRCDTINRFVLDPANGA